MVREENSWFYYKKILSWVMYVSIVIIGTIVLYHSVNYFFTKTFESHGIQYETYTGSYTSEPGIEVSPIDKKKWAKKSVDSGWKLQMLNTGYIHYVVAITIAFTLIIAIVGGLIIFRKQTKHPYR